MPGQKRKYNVRFPPGRIKKIMQKDTETSLITQSKNSRVMSVNHMKQCIESEKLFDFLKDLAEQACGTSAPKEAKGKGGKCPGHRRKWHNTSIKPKSPEKEGLPKRTNTEAGIRSDSSSESELVICLETQSP
ncbi:hypothetical protein NFI96_008057 [Prochilodus magdalenae]|nr:hypothetical protein NFI96_008057 [Prochilodus magdalenae]